MDKAKTLPGDLTSPVAGLLLQKGCTAIYSANGGRVIVLGIDSDEGAHVYDWAADRRIRVPLGALALDLSDTSSIDVAARWLAKHHGLVVGATAPRWYSVNPAGGEGFPQGAKRLWALTPAGYTEELFHDLKGWEGVTKNRHWIKGISDITDAVEAMCAACTATTILSKKVK